MRSFSLTSLDFRSTQILQFMTCNDSSRLWWSSSLSTTSIYRWTCSPPSALLKLLFAIFLKYLKCPTPVSVKKVKSALNCFEFPPIQRRSSLQQLKQNIYFTIWRKGEQRRHIFLPWDKMTLWMHLTKLLNTYFPLSGCLYPSSTERILQKVKDTDAELQFSQPGTFSYSRPRTCHGSPLLNATHHNDSTAWTKKRAIFCSSCLLETRHDLWKRSWRLFKEKKSLNMS